MSALPVSQRGLLGESRRITRSSVGVVRQRGATFAAEDAVRIAFRRGVKLRLLLRTGERACQRNLAKRIPW